MTTAILYGTLCAATYYLLARAKITQALWSRYPRWLDYWLGCAACSGTWYGIACGLLGWRLRLPLYGLDPRSMLAVVAAGATGMVWTPILAFAQVYAYDRLLTVRDEPPETLPSTSDDPSGPTAVYES